MQLFEALIYATIGVLPKDFDWGYAHTVVQKKVYDIYIYIDKARKAYGENLKVVWAKFSSLR
jgi:hypothetical protein